MDQVDLAIAKFKRHTTIGRIKSLDDLFLSAHFRQETTGYIPGPGATKFTLLLDSVSPNLIHKPSGQNIVVEITPALQQLIESTCEGVHDALAEIKQSIRSGSLSY